MASSASDLLKLELQADGENDSTWGALAVVLFERLEEAVAEMVTITVTGANYTLDDTQYVKNSGSTAESHVAMIKTTGTLTGNRSVIVPDRNKQYLIWNTNAGAYTLTVKTASGAGIVVPQDFLQHVFCDGTNVEAAGPAFDVNGALNMNGQSIFDTNGNELMTFTETGSAVNRVKIINAATGNAARVEADGETNVTLELRGRGTGQIILADDAGLEILIAAHVASAVNEITMSNAAAGNEPSIAATGDDTDIDIDMVPKGAGALITSLANYEDNVTGDDDFPNRKYCDDTYSGITRSVNAQTGTTYTLVLADAGKIITMSNASANTLTIPLNSSVAFPTNTQIDIIMKGAGTTKVDAATSVTLNGVSSGGADIDGQYQAVTIIKNATNTWFMVGAHGTVA